MSSRSASAKARGKRATPAVWEKRNRLYVSLTPKGLRAARGISGRKEPKKAQRGGGIALCYQVSDDWGEGGSEQKGSNMEVFHIFLF